MEERIIDYETLDQLSVKLEATLRGAIEYKSEIEQRWAWDERQYQGSSDEGGVAQSKAHLFDDFRGVSTPPQLNITRPKTQQAAARIGDMMFPTSDLNFELQPTPIPDNLLSQYEDPAEAKRASVEAMKRMTDRMKDQLLECNYSAEGRKAIFDGCRLGTGIMKGPVLEGTLKDSFRRESDGEVSVRIREQTADTAPVYKCVDPWNFFPSRSKNLNNCEKSFELHQMNGKMLRDLAKHPGFDVRQLQKLLKTEARHEPKMVEIMSHRSEMLGLSTQWKDDYAVWEYHGPIDSDALVAFGLIEENFEENLLEVYQGEVWFSQGIVLKIKLSPLDGETRLPYYAWSFEPSQTDIWGFGIPYIMRESQRVATATWQMMVYNGKMSSGPLIGIIKGLVTPADNDYNIAGPKVFYMEDEDGDLRRAIQLMLVPNIIADLHPLLELSKAFADEETNLPLIMQGEATQAVPTSSGLSMMMNSANVVLRRGAKGWDDDITCPAMKSLYTYNMLYDEDDSIKGDYKVIPRGVSYLLVKDVHTQHIQALTMLSQDPRFQVYIKEDELLKANVQALDIPAQNLIRTQEEVDELMSQQGEDPGLALEQRKLELEEMKIQVLAEDRARDDEYRGQERELLHNEKIAELQLKSEAKQADLMVAQMKLEASAMELMAKEQLTAADIEAQFKLEDSRQQTALLIQEMKINDRREEMRLKERYGTGI